MKGGAECLTLGYFIDKIKCSKSAQNPKSILFELKVGEVLIEVANFELPGPKASPRLKKLPLQ